MPKYLQWPRIFGGWMHIGREYSTGAGRKPDFSYNDVSGCGNGCGDDYGNGWGNGNGYGLWYGGLDV